MEDAAARVRGQLEAAAAEKREAAAGLSAADRDVILWDQRLQQERELQVRTVFLCRRSALCSVFLNLSRT